MDLSKEVEYRLAKWIFANIYHEGKIDEKTYHQLLNRLLDECNPPIADIYDSLHQTPEYSESGVPMVRVADVRQGDICIDNCLYVSEEVFKKYTKKHLPVKGDIVISRVGTYGVFSIVTTDERFCLGQNTAIISPKINCHYLFYYLISREAKEQIEKMVVGSTQKTISLKSIRSMQIPVPDQALQDKISSILRKIDDKIVTNSEINNNLVEQARTLLRIYISQSKDLKFITLGEVADINKGTYSPKEKWSFINYLDTSSVTDGIVSELQHLDTASDKVPSRARRKLQKKDIVYSIVRPNQRHFAIIAEPVTNMLASTGFAVIRSNTDGISNELLYLCLTDNMFIEQMQQIAEQSTSTFPSVKPSDLESCNIPVFSTDQSEELNCTLASIFSLYSMHQLENNSLSQLRDTLLPKLMSGEINVSDIDF